MTDEAKKKHRSAAKWAALFGVALGLVCSALPHDYRIICETVSRVCTGGGL